MNFQQQQEQIVANLTGVPSLLLHACCGPCSTACLEILAQHFRVTVLWFNPCIHPEAEYEKRLFYLRRVVEQLKTKHPVSLATADYKPETYFEAVKGLEQEPEGGARCTVCFRQRLEEAARYAKEQGFDWFTTTLTVSPHKNAPLINEIGFAAEEKFGVHFLPSDFKKKEGYKRSLTLSRELDLYRQNYCGCVFSMREE